MKHQSRLSQNAEHVEAQQTQVNPAKEFAGAEELLRFDAAQTTVPPEIARRLQQSAAEVRPPKSRPWWKNVFGR